MSKRSRESEYVPPPVYECEVEEYPIEPLYSDDGVFKVHVRNQIYRGKIVDYAITLFWRNTIDDQWSELYRVDTAHGEVHCHKKRRNGEERRVVKGNIPIKGWDYVHDSFTEEYDNVLDNMDAYYRGWNK